MQANDPHTTLVGVLARQRARDLLGPDPIEAQIAHAQAFATCVEAPALVVDLGSGGGVPGLVLAVRCWPEAEMVLLDASQRRCTFLEVAVAELEIADRVRVVWGRAEEHGRDAAVRGRADVVVARSFGAPAVTAECAAPLLRVGGHLLVSEPPGSDGSRWDPEGLLPLGLGTPALVSDAAVAIAKMELVSPCPDRYPRRPGLPARKPLF